MSGARDPVIGGSHLAEDKTKELWNSPHACHIDAMLKT